MTIVKWVVKTSKGNHEFANQSDAIAYRNNFCKPTDQIVQISETIVTPSATEIVLDTVVRPLRITFQNIFDVFIAENIAMGISIMGKTVVVGDYMENVRYHLMDRLSAHEAIKEIDKLMNPPSSLAPFVTNDRLSSFRNKITFALGKPNGWIPT